VIVIDETDLNHLAPPRVGRVEVEAARTLYGEEDLPQALTRRLRRLALCTVKRICPRPSPAGSGDGVSVAVGATTAG